MSDRDPLRVATRIPVRLAGGRSLGLPHSVLPFKSRGLCPHWRNSMLNINELFAGGLGGTFFLLVWAALIFGGIARSGWLG